MGALISRMKKQIGQPDEISVHGVITEDPRSPSEGINRTPIGAEKKKPYLETDLDATPTLPLRVRLLKKISDPRSPTAGINRTPIALMQSGTDFGSPISVYSNYQTDVDSLSCLNSPPEPSVNVSDFGKELDSLVEKLDKSFNDSLSPVEVIAKPKLSLKDKESKKICEELVQEIIESFKECENEMRKDEVKPEKQLKLSGEPQMKLTKRKPLSNITSAGNTPTKFQYLRKDEKIKIEMAGENSPILRSSMKQVVKAQWDQDSTVII